MKFQYEAPRLTLGVVAAVAIVIPILLGYFLVSGFANSKAYEDFGQPGASTTTTSSASSSVLSGVVQVSMPNGAGAPSGAPGFAPDNLTIAVGTTVVWTNNDPTAHHTVTSAPGNGTISSGDMAQGAIYNFTFTSPGTFNIICLYHSWMKQVIKVVTGPGSSPSVVTVSMPNGAGAPSGAPGYSPDVLNITTGTTVVWVNNDPTAHHTVTSVAGNGTISSGDMAQGASFNYTFTTPGTYNYICVYHSWMKGTVVVTGPPITSSTSSSSASSSSASSSSSSSSSSSGASLNAIQVSMPAGAGNPTGAPGFSPSSLTLVIGVNNTVTWTNNDSPSHHDVASTSAPAGVAPIASPDMPPGSSFTYTFTVPGTYTIVCTYHFWMKMTVTVVSG